MSHDNEDGKIEMELICQFKIGMMNLTNFDPSTLKNFKNLHIHGLLLTKVNNVSAKKSIEELYLIVLSIDAKFEGKMTCAFKTDMRNFANFHQSMFGSLKIVTLIGSIYPK